jgi:hypothetical protein
MENKLTGYELSRNFFDWAFENPEKINPSHIAIFFFATEHQNRLGGKTKFGFPTQMVMDALGIKKYQTYIKYFNDLVDWGFFILVEKSRNQYSANIISINYAMPKNGKALDKAFIKHRAKQIESNGQSKDSIDKQDNKEQIDNVILFNYKKCSDKELVEELSKFKETYSKDILNSFYRYWSEKDDKGKTKMSLEKTFEVDKRLITWSSNDKKFNKVENKIAEKNIIW